MTILIDADGYPVVDITINLAKEFGAECMIVCDTAHVFNKDGARTVTVSKGSDSVDFAMINMTRPGDVVITQDCGLAAMCMAKGAAAVNQDGLVYDEGNIDALLFRRHTAQQLLAASGRLKEEPKRTPAQDEAFRSSLRQILARMA